MAKKSAASEFFELSQSDAQLGKRILKIVESHAKNQANEIQKVARKAGFRFSQRQFEAAVRKSISAQFLIGKKKKKKKPVPRPPLSSCARGCLSWTHNWHPSVG